MDEHANFVLNIMLECVIAMLDNRLELLIQINEAKSVLRTARHS